MIEIAPVEGRRDGAAPKDQEVLKESLNALTFTMDVKETYSEAMDSSGGAFSASGGGIFWEVNAAASYWRESHATQNSVFVHIHASVAVPSMRANDPELTPHAMSLIDNIEAFTDDCGTHYVSQIYRGGEFDALIQVGCGSIASPRSSVIPAA